MSTRYTAWPGLDFQTVDSGLNPLLASYVGAPYQVRGTDPAPYAQDAVAWWQAVGAPNVPPDAGSGVAAQPVGLLDGFHPLDDLKSGFHTFWQSGAFVLLGLLVVAVGLLFLWKA